MSHISRRQAVKLTAGLALGANILAAEGARADAGSKLAEPAKDSLLQSALKSPASMMFTEQLTFKSDNDLPHSYDLKFTSAINPQTGTRGVTLRRAAMTVFHIDPTVDEFTQKGGLYWKCGKNEGKVQFKEPGAVVLAVRDFDGTTRCYALMYDLRC